MLEVSPNTQPDGLVGVIPGTAGVSCVAVAKLFGCDARPTWLKAVRFPAGSCSSFQALVARGASLDPYALVSGQVTIGVQKLSGKRVAAGRDLARVVGSLISTFCFDGTSTQRHYATGSVVASGPGRSLRFSVIHHPSVLLL